MKKFTLILISLLATFQVCLGSHETIELWPGHVPGGTEAKAPPVVSDRHTGNVTRLSKVTNPALIVYEADSSTKNGAAVIICPGGGYGILAIDKEGYEIGDWLSHLGYTCFVLQYRVPGDRQGALQDAMRAIRYVRSTHQQWQIDPNRIGLLGFSAGGSLAARVSTRYDEELYAPVDGIDASSARPDFAILIYPAYLDEGPNHTLTPELKVNQNTPPMFIFATADDPHANSGLVMGSALHLAKVPFELHILPRGGHGYGMRKGNRAAAAWPSLCVPWMDRTVLGLN